MAPWVGMAGILEFMRSVAGMTTGPGGHSCTHASVQTPGRLKYLHKLYQESLLHLEIRCPQLGVQADSRCQPFQGMLVFTVRHVARARPLEGPQVAMKRRDHLALHLQESSGLLLAPLKYGEPAGDPWRGLGVLALYSLDASIFALNL